MRFTRVFFLAILVSAPASGSAGCTLHCSFCFDKKVEVCIHPGGISSYCVPNAYFKAEFTKYFIHLLHNE